MFATRAVRSPWSKALALAFLVAVFADVIACIVNPIKIYKYHG